MNYTLLKNLIQLLEQFESNQTISGYSADINGFKKWIYEDIKNSDSQIAEPDWEGKNQGRSAESVINTLLVHLNRYAKTYSKAAIHNSDFSTQEEFIYLINLKAFGELTKMELIKKNIQDKPTGMQIINRLLEHGWVKQKASQSDKRSKILSITTKGLKALDQQMDSIRKATRIVTGNLNQAEKTELIHLLQKLEKFHNPIFLSHIENDQLLDYVIKEYLPENTTL
jgi:MarR family transcriptional regulator, lower aerobic nicotinate degradation pathway regulator